MEHTLKNRRLRQTVGLGVALLVGQAQAIELYADADTQVTGNFLAVYGMFNSPKNYDGRSGGSTWREAFIKYGLSVEQSLGNLGGVYGTANLVSSGTWGDGDAAGLTNGTERTTKFDEAFAGWRSGELLPALGRMAWTCRSVARSSCSATVLSLTTMAPTWAMAWATASSIAAVPTTSPRAMPSIRRR